MGKNAPAPDITKLAVLQLAVADATARGPAAVGLSHMPRADYLAPASVSAVGPSFVEVTLVDGTEVSAKLALGIPYQPVVGDQLLVIGNRAEYWVIGIVAGSGQTQWRMAGDIELHAIDGKLRLSGDRGVTIEGQELSLRARRLAVSADVVVQKFTNMVTRVKEMLSVRAGERHTIVDGHSLEKADRATILTEDIMSINGKQVHLG